MYILFSAVAFLCFGFVASAQVKDKIEKAAHDPATAQRSAKADALLIDTKRILPGKDSTKNRQPATPINGRKKRPE